MADEAPWWGWQMLNFVRQSDGKLYLIMADGDNMGEPVYVGHDWLRLFEVIRSGTNFTLDYRGERRLYTQRPEMGNVKAASGVYVSPSGELIVYTAHHDPQTREGVRVVEMGEFRHYDVTHNAEQVKDPWSGWVELYADQSGWDNNERPERSLMFDYKDYYEFPCCISDNSDDLGDHDDWNDIASAVRWNLAPGQVARLYEHSGFDGEFIELTGKGFIRELIKNDWISSVQFLSMTSP